MDEENENFHNTHIITKSTISNHSFQLNNSYFIQKNLNGNESFNKNNIYGSKIINDFKNNNNNNNDNNNDNLNILFNQIYKKNTNDNKYAIYFKNLKNELDKNTDNENFFNNKNSNNNNNNNNINENKNKKLINNKFKIIENEKCNSKFQVVQTTLSLMKSPENKIKITNKFDEDSLEISRNDNINNIIYKNLIKRKKSLNSIHSSKNLNNSENSISFIKLKKNFKDSINLKELKKLKNNLNNESNLSYLEKMFYPNKRRIKLENIENNKKYSNSLIYSNKDKKAIYDDIYNNLNNNRLNNNNNNNNINNDLNLNKNNINKNNNNLIKRIISANYKKVNKNQVSNIVKLPLSNRTDRKFLSKKEIFNLQKNKNLTNNNLNRNYKIKHNNIDNEILPDINKKNKNGFGKNNSCINLNNIKFNNINKDNNIKNDNKTLLSKIINNNGNNLLNNKKELKKNSINNSNISNLNDNIENFDTKEITLQKKNSLNVYEKSKLYNNNIKKVKSKSIIESNDITFKNNKDSPKNYLSDERENNYDNNNNENNKNSSNNTLLKSKSYRDYDYNNNNKKKIIKYPSTALLNKNKIFENNSNLCFKDFLFDKNYINSFSSRLHRNLSSLLLPISQFNYNNYNNNFMKNNKEIFNKRDFIKKNNRKNGSYKKNTYYTYNQETKTRNKENKFTLDNLKDNNNPYSINWCNNLLKKNFGQELNIIGTINGAPKIGIKNSKSFSNFKDIKSYSNSVTKRDFYKTLQKTYSKQFFWNKNIKEEKREKSGNILKKYPSIYKYFNSNSN